MTTESADEIDLRELAITFIRYIQRNLKFIIACTATCVLLSVAFYFFYPKTYDSRMIVMSDILTESYSKEIAESISNLIKEDNYKALSSRLEVSELEASQLKSFQIEGVKKERPSEKESENNIFNISIKTLDNTLLPKFEKGIVQSLRNNEFIKIRVRQRKEMYQRLIDKISLEISSLDSLKARLFKGKPIYSKSAEMMLVDPTNIYSKIIELNKEQINYKNALELADSIQIVEGFTPVEMPSFPKLSILLVAGIVCGFIISLIILSLSSLFKLANQPS